MNGQRCLVFLMLAGFLFPQGLEAAEYFTGKVWNDLDKDGIEDAGEPAVQGVTVTVNGVNQITDANGEWTSQDLSRWQNYTVTFSNIPSGYVFTLQNQGSDDTIDSDADPVTGVTGSYNAGRNKTTYDIDAGIYEQVVEMDVQGGFMGMSIMDGDVSPSILDDTFFGNVDIVTGTAARTFTILSTGDGSLELDGSPIVDISGAHASDFSVTAMPASPIAGGNSDTFEITFDPSAEGSRSATITISNNDSDEDPYTFAVQGTGTATPEIDIKGNGVDISDGDTSPSTLDDTDFGPADIYGGANVKTFTIYNPGSGDLTLSGSPNVQISGSHASDFTVTSQPASNTVTSQGGTRTFQITFDPSSTGLRQASVNITSDDGNESPYTFTIQGTGTINPEIDIKGNGVTITSGDILPTVTDSTDFGSSEVGDMPLIVTYTIYNTGPATLNLLGAWPLVQVTGTHSGDFSVYSAPSSSVSPGGSTNFQIAFDPITSGLRTATLTIDNNDLSEPGYTFAIQGTGVYNTDPLSEIDVQGNLISIPDGDSSPNTSDGSDFGSISVDGATSSQTFTIKNLGTEDLVLTANPLVSVAGAHASDFSVIQQPSSPVAPGATVPFIVSFDPSSGGTRSAYITIENNDGDESPYDFTIRGTGLTAPEMKITGNGVEIADGDNSPVLSDSTYVGDVTASLGVTYVTYTIHNTGSTTLNLTGSPLVSILGDAAAEFSVTSMPNSSISAGGTSDFVVAFDPSQVGARDAAISITSDDSDESPYNFSIRGNGTGPGSPLVCAPNFFHIFGDNGTIAYLDATTNPYTYTTITVAGYSINGLGYNLEDGLIYGFEMDTDVAGDRIVRIDGTGAITVLTSVTIPYESWRADFNDTGDMYFWNSNGTAISIFDASEGTVTSQNTGGTDWLPIDMAYLDNTGKFYGIHTTTLYIYDPITNSVSTQPITGRLADEYATGTNSIYYGAAWTAYDGYLYTTNSQSGRMYKINVSSYESVYVGQGEANLNKSDGASCPLADAPLPETGTVGDFVWIDEDMDGIQDASEVGLPGVTINLYFSDDTFVATTTTDQDGAYSFTNLTPSDYYMEFTGAPSGFSLTSQDQGSNNLVDSDVNPSTGKTEDFFVSVGLIEEGLDAGYTSTGLGNFVWNDLDEDGVQDLGEPGVPGVTVELLLASNSSVVSTTTTDAEGLYLFSGVSPTSYLVRISNLPGGFTASPQNAGGNDDLDSDINTGTLTTGSYTISSGVFNASVDAGIYQNTSPEMNLVGNNQNISDGDATPSTADHTDFGSVSAASGTIVRTFTVENTTGADLTLNGTPIVEIGGTDAADFTVTANPSTTITSGSSTTFQITFDPSALGVRSAYVSISNNDDDENPYDFNIQGTGLTPEILVKGNGVEISSGDATPGAADSTDLGGADVATGLTHTTFKILNTGNASLALTGSSPYFTITGTNAADFTISTAPSASIAAGDSSSFVVQFNPGGEGLRTATLSLANDDLDENPYIFDIQGTGTSFPEMEMQAGPEFIADGDLTPSTVDLTDFGSKDIISEQATHTFTIRNTGSGDLTLTGLPMVQVTGANAGDFVVTQMPASSTVSPSGTQTFQVTFNPTTTGVRQASLVIPNDDSNENPYNFAIQGLGTSTIDEEMEVLGNGVVINSGDISPSASDFTDLGTAEISKVPETSTFVIRNVGYAVLNLTGPPPYVDITGVHASEFSITSSPAVTVAIDSATTSFEVSFTPAGLGTRSATISIQNDDADENPYTFAIQGTGVYDPFSQSEINVEGNFLTIPSGDTTPDGSDGTEFGTVEVVGGFTSSRDFVIRNLGTDDLVLGNTPKISISGTHASDFSVSAQPASPVAPGSTVSMSISFDPSATGLRTATVSIGNSDSDENPYTFAIQGTGTTVPEISLSGNSVTITNGDNTPGFSDSTYFGDVDANLGATFVTYTIHNTGSSTLTLTGTPAVNIIGDHASDYTVTTPPSSSIGAGSSSSFIVKFDPSIVGLRNATISITSNDSEETPYLYAIQGNGTGPGSPLACVPNFFHVYGSNGTIAYLDASVSPYVYTTIATAGFEINGVGYNLEDGLLYGFNMSTDNLIRIDATGTVTTLSNISNNYGSWRADFNNSGDFYFWNSTGDQVGIFDASAGTVSYQNTSGDTWTPIDMAYLDSDGNFYGVHTTTLFKYNPSTDVVSTSQLTGKLVDDYNSSTNSIYYGAAWSANDGYLYTTNSQSGRMYKINVTSYETIYVGQGEANLSSSDGASCPLAASPLPTTGSIGNFVWLDADDDGIQDAGETGLAGVTVSLYDADDTFLNSYVTTSTGAYVFENLSPSQYYLTFTNPPTGFSLTAQDQGANNDVDSDADPTTGKTDLFTVDIGSIDNSLDAGFKATGVGDFVWLDVDEDGVQDPGEAGVPGIDVEIKLESNGSSVATTTTDANGFYCFKGLTNTTYRLYFTNLPAGYVFSPADQGGDDDLDSDINTGTGQSPSFTLTSGMYDPSIDAGVYQQSEPEINVVGNATVSIADGDVTPTTADNTDFGSISAVIDSVSYTFFVINVSGADLTLNGTPKVAISGTNASEFTVTTQPAETIVADDTTSFVIKFKPTAEGLRTASVSIANTDADENPYDFNIRGFGLASEISVSGGSNDISDGATVADSANLTDFGSEDINTGSQAHIFSILNTGNANLILEDPAPHVTISGTHAADFTLTSAPTSPVASNATTQFTITFDPSAAGVRTATVSIANNDIDEDPFDFVISGTGTATPEIDVQGNGELIADGDITPTTTDLTDFGSKDILTDTQVNTFTILNPGSGTLTLSGTPVIAISGAHEGDFSISTEPASNTVTAGGNVTFDVTFNPTSVGLRTAVLSISSDDSDENPFNFAIQGTGVASSEIDVLGNNLSIASGDLVPGVLDSTYFDSTIVDSAFSITYTIENSGSAALNLTGVSPYISIGGENAADFSVTAIPNPLIAAGGGTTTFTITFTPSAEGMREATISIASDDSDEDPYTFAIQGVGLPTPQPELTLIETVDLAIAAPGDTLTYTVVYSNVGVGLATNVVLDQEIPPETTYLQNTASGDGMVLYFSHDNGTNFDMVQTAPVTHVRFQRTTALPAGGNGTVIFKVTVD